MACGRPAPGPADNDEPAVIERAVIDQVVIEQALIEQAGRMLAGQADVALGEAYRRMTRYARFNDLPLLSVSRGILADTIRLLTIRESDLLEDRAGGGAGRDQGLQP